METTNSLRNEMTFKGSNEFQKDLGSMAGSSANSISNMKRLSFDGGSFKLIDFSPVDEDVLLAQFGIKEDDARQVKPEALKIVTSHTNLIFDLSLTDHAYITLLEHALSGSIQIGKLTKVASSKIEWGDKSIYRKRSTYSGKSSIPSSSVADQGKVAQIFDQLESNSIKAARELHELGLCTEQLESAFPRTKVSRFVWSTSLSNIIGLINLIDDETVIWEIRSLGMKLKQLTSKLFPVLCLEFNR